MQFDSITFLVFFMALLAIYNLPASWSSKKNQLLLGSYIFYGAWNPWFLPLLLFTTTLDWLLAIAIDKAQQAHKKIFLTLTVVANLSVLIFFKYIVFFFEVIQDFLAIFSIHMPDYEFSIILPLGISFYTFHSLSYCIDVYRGKFKATRNWRDYALYVSFFPQLVAGPIVRWTFMREQIETPRKSSLQGLTVGLAFMVLGMFEKVVLSDNLFAPIANQLFALENVSSGQAWLATAAFTGQIFCDFAGYSTCAIGAALALGFRLPINFRNPYGALGFSDFWQRWHISLSTWLRDYLYIPLGGNRGSALFTHRNLMLTMLIGGLWHGAAWNFIVWGGIHGLLLIMERLVKQLLGGILQIKVLRPLNAIVGWLLTLLAVMFAWTWFRVTSLEQGLNWSQKLLNIAELMGSARTVFIEHQLMLGCFLALVAIHVLFRQVSLEQLIHKTPLLLLALIMGVLAAFIVISPGDSNAFIYFQF
ncbi:MAG TPA: MBOAT family O-acyltransferase [Pseudomonadales bacterium]|nr:MBOAT family O-acyltransferase [Pseudomonadales bacterium]